MVSDDGQVYCACSVLKMATFGYKYGVRTMGSFSEGISTELGEASAVMRRVTFSTVTIVKEYSKKSV